MCNYPAGAENDPRAPYNQVEPEELNFEVEITHYFSLKPTVQSSDYTGGGYDDEGYPEQPDYEGNAVEDFINSYMPLSEVLKRCAKLVENAKEVNNRFNTHRIGRKMKDSIYREMLKTIDLYLNAEDDIENV